jgi:hypothetical protein
MLPPPRPRGDLLGRLARGDLPGPGGQAGAIGRPLLRRRRMG